MTDQTGVCVIRVRPDFPFFFAILFFQHLAGPTLLNQSSITALTSEVGSPLKLSCTFSTPLSVDIGWSLPALSNQLPQSSGRYIINTTFYKNGPTGPMTVTSLQVQTVVAEDIGTYACTASNSGGNTIAKFEVTGKFIPEQRMGYALTRITDNDKLASTICKWKIHLFYYLCDNFLSYLYLML